jgi:transposase
MPCMKAYSEDLRLRVLAALDGGISRTDAASTFRVSLSSIKRWRAQHTALGHLRPKRPTGRPRAIGVGDEARLRIQLTTTPDATLPEHLSTWKRQQGRSLSRWTLSRSIKRLRWSRKKRL